VKKHTPEQIVKLRDQVEVTVSSGKTTALACKEAVTTEQAYYGAGVLPLARRV
jgi:hypothetical protein